jgi:hypothetical protein
MLGQLLIVGLLGRAEVAGDDMALLHARLFTQHLGAACDSPSTCDSAANATAALAMGGSMSSGRHFQYIYDSPLMRNCMDTIKRRLNDATAQCG